MKVQNVFIVTKAILPVTGVVKYTKLFVRKKTSNIEPSYQRMRTNYQQIPVNFSNNARNSDFSYADITRQRGYSAGEGNLFAKIELMLSKQLELTNNLISMMSLLLNKLCK